MLGETLGDDVLIDMHVHLDEGPYYTEYSNKIMNIFSESNPLNGSKEALVSTLNKTLTMINQNGYSDAWLDEYLKVAIEKGLTHVGIVDHVYRFKEFEAYFNKHILLDDSALGLAQQKWLNNVQTSDLHTYLNFMRKAKEKWKQHGIVLSIGLEVDYFIEGESELREILEQIDIDYIIGSVHFYKGWGFDNPVLQDRFNEYNLVELYEEHFNTVIKAAESRLFDFIAHLDNIKVFKYRPDEHLLLPFYENVAIALKDNNVATEVNVGLKYRYPVKEQCPSEQFIKVLSNHEVEFTTSSDSHLPNDIGIYKDEIINLLKKNQIDQIVRFEDGKKIKVSI